MTSGDFPRAKHFTKKGKEPTSPIHPHPSFTQRNSEKHHPQKLQILQNDLEISQIFSFPSLVYFKRDKSISKFLVRSALTYDRQPGTFKCKRSRCKTFIRETPTRSHDLNGPSKSVIDLHASPVVLSSA